MPATFSIPRTNDLEHAMTAVMIGVDPHKGSHTAVVISPAEEPLGEIRVRASAAQAEKLAEWAAAWPERTWAVEGAAGLGRLLARQLVAAGDDAGVSRFPSRDHFASCNGTAPVEVSSGNHKATPARVLEWLIWAARLTSRLMDS
jgi:hypothetical protein